MAARYAQKARHPILLEEFSEIFEQKSANSNNIFNAEFVFLNASSTAHNTTTTTTTVAEDPVNNVKNRYTDILPYDHSRVKLSVSRHDSSDYINANYIPGKHGPKEYIACQGPLPTTLVDFWRMILEQKVRIVVMTTNLKEKNKVKCTQYWPRAVGKTEVYGSITVQLVSETYGDSSNYVIRVFDISVNQSSKPCRVTQYHFVDWPDFGVPADITAFLRFVLDVRERADTGPNVPLVVHCSAGVGRTGTFILVDRMLEHIQDHDSVNLFEMVLEMRQHRTNMVQTQEQYVFAHACVNVAIEKRGSESDRSTRTSGRSTTF